MCPLGKIKQMHLCAAGPDICPGRQLDCVGPFFSAEHVLQRACSAEVRQATSSCNMQDTLRVCPRSKLDCTRDEKSWAAPSHQFCQDAGRRTQMPPIRHVIATAFHLPTCKPHAPANNRNEKDAGFGHKFEGSPQVEHGEDVLQAGQNVNACSQQFLT